MLLSQPATSDTLCYIDHNVPMYSPIESREQFPSHWVDHHLLMNHTPKDYVKLIELWVLWSSGVLRDNGRLCEWNGMCITCRSLN